MYNNSGRLHALTADLARPWRSRAQNSIETPGYPLLEPPGAGSDLIHAPPPCARVSGTRPPTPPRCQSRCEAYATEGARGVCRQRWHFCAPPCVLLPGQGHRGPRPQHGAHLEGVLRRGRTRRHPGCGAVLKSTGHNILIPTIPIGHSPFHGWEPSTCPVRR
jgi:hypothetical protein